MKLFLLKNATADVSNLTRNEYERLFNQSIQEYGNANTNDPNLTAFRDRGGKMITYHGLVRITLYSRLSFQKSNFEEQADLIIPTRGSEQYYDAVTAVDATVHDYYRLFLAPGLDHCFGGAGAYPAGTFDAMRDWVENGTVPEILMATSSPDALGNSITRPLCPYPKKQVYNGKGDSTTGEGFYCS